MARLVGVDLPREKRLEVALTYIFGVGRTRAQETLAATGISGDIRVRDLGDERLVALRDYIEANFQIEGDLRREVAADIRRKVEIGSYEGRATVAVSPSAASAPRPTRAPARAPSAPWPARRRRADPAGPHGPAVLRRPPHPRDARHIDHLNPPEEFCRMAPKIRQASGARKPRRKDKKNVVSGQAHIKSTFNNTIVSITDPTGAVISWASAGQVGFKGSRKSTPYAAQMAAEAAGRRAQEHGMKKVDVFVKGPGSGRETAIRSLTATGLEVGSIQDVTPRPHNGTRPPKRRRV